MSLIFHSFPNDIAACSFGGNVKSLHGLEWALCSAQAQANAIDPFPYELTPPIVLIERPSEGEDREEYGVTEGSELEDEIELFVVHFGGKFAGT
jgi:hypothetical protein